MSETELLRALNMWLRESLVRCEHQRRVALVNRAIFESGRDLAQAKLRERETEKCDG